MQEKPKTFRLERLLRMAASGQFDVPEVQRLFNRNGKWCAELLDSLHRGISLNALLCWAPESGRRPTAGRYRDESTAEILIVDGQQRLTGLLAALGMQPPWIPQAVWAAMGGPQLQASVAFDKAGMAVFRSVSEGGHPAVAMGEVIDAPPDQVVAAATGAGLDSAQALHLLQLVGELKASEILVAWLPDDDDTAMLGFERHNRQPSLTLRPGELRLCRLSKVFGPLQRRYVDPLLLEAFGSGLQRTITAQRITTMVQSEIPGSAGQRVNASAEQIQDAAARVMRAYHDLLPYLACHGVTSDALVAAPSLVEVMAYLFMMYPQASSDDFASRWLAHTIARGVYSSRRSIGRHNILALRRTNSYEQAQAALAEGVPVEPAVPTFGVDGFNGPRSQGTFGPGGTLYAMAAARGVDGSVRDLGSPRLRFPDRRLALRPLLRKPEHGNLAHYAFMTEQTAQVIAEQGGWTSNAVQQLGCDSHLLNAQHLPAPVPGLAGKELADWLTSARTPLIIRVINRLMSTIGPLHHEPAVSLLVAA